MIRYVPISKDTEVFPDKEGFAFYDTVHDAFVMGGAWQTWDDFEAEFKDPFGRNLGPVEGVFYTHDELERFRRLMPKKEERDG